MPPILEVKQLVKHYGDFAAVKGISFDIQEGEIFSLRGQGVAGILPEAGVLLGFAAVFFVIGIWRFRYE